MSDVGKYDLVEAEIMTKLASMSGVSSLSKTLSVTDLVNRDGIQKPAVGVIHGGMQSQAPYGLGTGLFFARTTWHIAVVANNARGAVSARTTIYNILELIRSKLHHKTSAYSPSDYMLVTEEWPDQHPEGLIAAVAVYQLDMILGAA